MSNPTEATHCLIALGSNLGDRLENLRAGVSGMGPARQLGLRMQQADLELHASPFPAARACVDPPSQLQ